MADHEERETSNEIELYAELGLTELGPVPTVGIRVKHARKRRAKVFGEAVAERVGIELEELGQRLEAVEDDRVLTVFDQTLQRAADAGDPQYADALGRLAGAALDNVRIDEVEFLVREVLQLDPIHLRTLFEVAYEWVGPGSPDVVHTPATAESGTSDTFLPADVEQALHVTNGASVAIVQRLTGAGFLRERDVPVVQARGATGKLETRQHYTAWEATPWAKQAVRHMFPNLR